MMSKACNCLQTENPKSSIELFAIFRGLTFATIRWFTPAMLLAAMPKCPVCMAAYVGIFTGLGVSIPTAGYLRVALIIICATLLSYSVISALHRRLKTVQSGSR